MTDEIKAAFDIYNDRICKFLPREEQLADLTFSDRFLKRMDRLMKFQEKIYYPLFNTVAKRVASILVACLLLMTAVTFSVRGLREPFFDFIVEVFEKFSILTFTEEPKQDQTGQKVLTAAYPQYIPEGFELVFESEDDMSAQRIYENKEKQVLTVEQHLLDEKLNVGIDTEGVNYKKVMVNDLYTAMLLENKGQRFIVFNAENSVYIISLPSVLAEKVLIKVAESIFF